MNAAQLRNAIEVAGAYAMDPNNTFEPAWHFVCRLKASLEVGRDSSEADQALAVLLNRVLAGRPKSSGA